MRPDGVVDLAALEAALAEPPAPGGDPRRTVVCLTNLSTHSYKVDTLALTRCSSCLPSEVLQTIRHVTPARPQERILSTVHEDPLAVLAYWHVA